MVINAKKVSVRISMILIGLMMGLILIELLLRVYNPIPTRVIGNELHLLTNYKRTVTVQKMFQQNGLEESIFYSTNSIGFRGTEPPVKFDKYLTIFTVGGSTTECSLLDDKKTWTAYLDQLISAEKDSVWINNAGIDGASTIGHQLLFTEQLSKYKPDIILFLVGINEMWIAEYGTEALDQSRESNLRIIASKSELFSFLWNVYRQMFSKTLHVGHQTTKVLEDLTEEEYDKNELFYLNDQANYKGRLQQLMSDCKDQGIIPVLITQPVYRLTSLHPYSFIKIYNETTKQVSIDNNVTLIDLAAKLEDDPDYYYDPVHYTAIGSKRIAEIIGNELIDHINMQD